MKSLKTLLAVLLSSLCIPFTGCNDDYSHLSPEEAIIGKWKLIKSGIDEEHLKPVDLDSWHEYHPDKTMYDDINSLQFTYYMDQECLYRHLTRGDQLWVYEYKFTDKKNTLTLKYRSGVIPTIYGFPLVYIYRRIK
ncbi:MAG: hypothetical protein LBC19_10160 [Tannerella sp.]|jgi:hypothetical protein|nr:hypothetical protein [Tannerella sp.]